MNLDHTSVGKKFPYKENPRLKFFEVRRVMWEGPVDRGMYLEYRVTCRDTMFQRRHLWDLAEHVQELVGLRLS